MRQKQYNSKSAKVDHKEVLRLHSNHYTIKDICEQLGITEHVVNKILKSNGLRGGTKIDRLKDKYTDIIKSYQQTEKLTLVAKEFNITGSLVRKILKLHDIPLRQVEKELDNNEVINFYKQTHKVRIVADKFGVSDTVILKLLHKNNVRVSKIKYTEQEIIEKYLELKTIESTSTFLDVSKNYISNILKSHNIKLRTLTRKEIGDVFGKLTIIEEVEAKVTSGGEKKRQFILRCECGELVKRNTSQLTTGKSWHCGCVIKEGKRLNDEKKRILRENYKKRLIEREEKRKNKPVKESRQKYKVGTIKDMLTILSIGTQHYSERTVVCQCKCGKVKEMHIKNFYITKSCGCFCVEQRRKATMTHGHSSILDMVRRKFHDRWKGMVKRCYNPKMHAYSNYGGRGIKVCDRWLEPDGVGSQNYYEDIHNILGPQPGPNYSLDRIDNDGNYEISNLRWATLSTQSKNQRRNIKSGNSD